MQHDGVAFDLDSARKCHAATFIQTCFSYQKLYGMLQLIILYNFTELSALTVVHQLRLN